RPDLKPSEEEQLTFGKLLRPEKICTDTFVEVVAFKSFFEDNEGVCAPQFGNTVKPLQCAYDSPLQLFPLCQLARPALTKGHQDGTEATILF
ncbi:uncharacterized protein VP01_8013g1, partial [Puccinia sorghi]